MLVAVSFTNIGPYHLARLRALAGRLRSQGHALAVVETASREERYLWSAVRADEPFAWHTLFPERSLESLAPYACKQAMRTALRDLEPDVVMVAGYVRPECLAAQLWARRHGRAAVLMSESHAADKPRLWWKEAVKRVRVVSFDSALVGGPAHHDYLVSLGMPNARITLGYNAVDNDRIVHTVDTVRASTSHTQPPYFLAVNRLSPEKNLARLLKAYALYRQRAGEDSGWPLVIAGDGPERPVLDALAGSLGIAARTKFVGFLQQDELVPLYAHAGAFVLASSSEPWGLVVNEAAAAALPLIVSHRAGCAETLVPDPPGSTGCRIEPLDLESIANALWWMAGLGREERDAMGARARRIVAEWGPSRFADGAIDAIELAREHASTRRLRNALAR